ncbi:hypothetical protein [Streptomyces sp. NPDC050485]|uniref:hypothetical protein n=1 Tax=Streptomyces sp. NPDC050485 TaxID=3365617 RepID=UPI00378EDF62
MIPCRHTQQTVVDGQDHAVRLGVRVFHQKSRCDKLSSGQLAERALGWAGEAG